MLAVFERIDLGLVEQILSAALGEAAFEFVSVLNQPAGPGESVVNARISAHLDLWIETKTEVNEIRPEQLEGQLVILTREGLEALLVVMPRSGSPARRRHGPQ